jgi:CspA family cold shock protein
MPTGTLKKFFADKGFGFIQQDDGQPDLFAHKRALLGANEAMIQEGVKVTFVCEMEERTGKPKASTWSIIDAAGAAAAAAVASNIAAMSQPDYGALAAASFGAMSAAAGVGGMSPYGALGATMPGLTMQMPGLAPGLPLGWEQVADPTTGKPYYCNRATGESSWTPPVAAAPTFATMPAMAPAAVATPMLPAGWEMANDPASGKPYYFNRATNETSWTIPGAAA